MKRIESTPIPPQTVLGLMSGTSLDGLDISTSRFSLGADGSCSGELIDFRTVAFPEALRGRLERLYTADAREWVACSADFSIWCAEAIGSISVAQLVGFHGQTIFHEPHLGYTGQLASGAHLHARLGIPVVCDFRSLDVALGGQGAPLVPAADALLYPEAEAAVNLGGIANISLAEEGLAWDVMPCNLLLNGLAQRLGQPCDWDGQWAASGQIIPELLAALRAVPYLELPAPKSLGREAVDAHFWPVIEQHADASVPDLLATVTAFIAFTLAEAIGSKTALVTGGGAWNTTLMNAMKVQHGVQTLQPDDNTINGKEAHAFAFLAWLRVHGISNVWSRFTGAKADSHGGCIYGDIRPLWKETHSVSSRRRSTHRP